jgi:cysteine-rich repeat protein
MTPAARRALLAAIAGLAVSGCLQSAAVVCDNGSVCPRGFRCGSAGEREVCVPVSCGNARIDPGELCDDGNNTSGDSCPANCGATCGDNRIDPGEACDDGNQVSGDDCPADCSYVEVCGNDLRDAHETCDDGNLQDQDGCSSRCSVEAPAWTTIDGAPDAGPGNLVYDAARSVLVLLDAGHNTWEWDGAHWLRRAPRTIPRSIRPDIVTPMFYDPLRQRVVLYSDGVWEWNGGDWTERVGVFAPPLSEMAVVYDPVRRKLVMVGIDYTTGTTLESDGTSWERIGDALNSHAIAFDSRRGKVVQYAGNGSGPIPLPSSFPTGYLVEYDGMEWTERRAPGGPACESEDMVYDAARNQLVVFATLHDSMFQRYTETWTWDGARWDRRVAGSGPELRSRPAMAYDVVHQQLVLFGGQRYMSSTGLSDTWLWSGVDWSAPELAAPPPRAHHAMAYDAARATAVVFGGLAQTGAGPDPDPTLPLGDTWLWNGHAWRAAEGGPPPRADHAMAFHPARGRTVLFGGSDANGRPLADTWEWDGVRWLDRAPAPGPAARRGHAMVHDAARAQLMIFGGGADGTLLSDQWLWTGTEWTDQTPVAPAARPPGRSEAAIADDAQRGRVVLFGGRGSSGLLNDVWEWDGAHWIEASPSGRIPTARAGHSLVYDPALRRIVLFGGHDEFTKLNDTWTWDGARWTELIMPAAPPAREHHTMIYDPIRRQVVLFAGAAANVLGDLWFWRYRDGAAPAESCDSGFDGDGDRKIGCDDPDCSTRCIACGDGVCSALENCRLCPADCGTCQLCGDLLCDPGETTASCPGDCPS